MKILTITADSDSRVIDQVVEVLERGGMIVYPTETAYGLGVDATNEKAVARLLEFKGKRNNKAISVAVCDIEMAEAYVKVNETARHLYTQFLPGPITVVSESKGVVVRHLESERQTLGIRVPNHPVALGIVKSLGRPITATSANTSGQKTPYSFVDWKKYTSPKKQQLVDIFLDAGDLGNTPPSTVVDTTLNELSVLRQGTIHLSDELMRVSNSAEVTQEIAGEIVEKYVDMLKSKALVIALQGELGTGKTEFAKGVGKVLGISDPIVSPTFQIMNEYAYSCGKVSGKMVHIDTWRLEDMAEMESLNVDKYLKSGTVLVIEWLEKIRCWLDSLESKASLVWVTIEGLGNEQRQIRVKEGTP